MTPSRPHLAHVSLDVLHLFRRVAALGSIAAAARELELSPSLATRRLAGLETALALRLFQRTTRRLKLTEAGEVMLGWAAQAVDSFHVASDDLAAVVGQPMGLVRLCANHYAAHVLLPPLLARFCAQYPEITLSISTSDNLVDMIAGGFDVAIHSGRIPDSSVIGLRVVEFRRTLCAAPAYLARHGHPRSIEDLARHRCLVHASNEPANWFFRKDATIHGQPVAASIAADSHLLLLELARQGLGIARLSRDVIAQELAKGSLVELLPEYECVYSSGELPALWIAYPNRSLLFRVRLLVDFLSKSLDMHR